MYSEEASSSTRLFVVTVLPRLELLQEKVYEFRSNLARTVEAPVKAAANGVSWRPEEAPRPDAEGKRRCCQT
jgi:hypothetical protein